MRHPPRARARPLRRPQPVGGPEEHIGRNVADAAQVDELDARGGQVPLDGVGAAVGRDDRQILVAQRAPQQLRLDVQEEAAPVERRRRARQRGEPGTLRDREDDSRRGQRDDRHTEAARPEDPEQGTVVADDMPIEIARPGRLGDEDEDDPPAGRYADRGVVDEVLHRLRIRSRGGLVVPRLVGALGQVGARDAELLHQVELRTGERIPPQRRVLEHVVVGSQPLQDARQPRQPAVLRVGMLQDRVRRTVRDVREDAIVRKAERARDGRALAGRTEERLQEPHASPAREPGLPRRAPLGPVAGQPQLGLARGEQAAQRGDVRREGRLRHREPEALGHALDPGRADRRRSVGRPEGKGGLELADDRGDDLSANSGIGHREQAYVCAARRETLPIRIQAGENEVRGPAHAVRKP